MAKVEDGSIESFRPQRRNLNKHSQRGMGALEASMRKHGYVAPMTAAADGEIIDGSARLETVANVFEDDVLIVHHDGTRPVVMVRDDIPDASTNEARAISALANRIAEINLTWDAEELLADLQSGVDFGNVFDQDELDALLAGLVAPELVEDVEPQIDKADELRQKWGVELGQIWSLGQHRLICGDCTDNATVERLMQSDRFDLVVTSPPYNSGDGGYKTDYNGKTKRFYQEDTDNRTEAEWVEFCESVLTLCGQYARDDKSVIAWNVMYTARCRSGYGQVMFGGRQPFTVKETICWDKGAGFPTASKGILSRNWELIFVLSKGEKYNTTQGDNEPRWSKWDIARPKVQDENHKATYPVELPLKVIDDFSFDGSIVFEPFNGSGTTIIACEQAGRIARAVELSPAYVAVALQRFQDATGQTPVLIDTGNLQGT